VIYKKTDGTLWAKKGWIHFLGIITGIFQIAIGTTNSHSLHTMVGLIAGMAFFLEAGNGANFALVPHVHPYANGIVSGLVGATGNVSLRLQFRFPGRL
jgi:NNP family nitrate/nitrite transporter-like MFS transporter